MRLRTKMSLAAWLLGALLGLGMMGQTRADSVDDYLKAEMARRHIPGLSVAVVQGGKVVKSQGYGSASLELSVPATAMTAYQIGSLTKQFTAAAILSLAQDGKLNADDKITKYLGVLPGSWKAITIRQLLNQTSGIPNYRGGIDIFRGAYLRDYTGAEIIKLASAHPLLFTPGTQFNYSNTNYHLLGMIVEKVSGKPYAQYLQTRFFGPLGMTHTRLNDPSIVVANRAQGCLWDGTTLQNSIYVFSPTVAFGDDGVLSTVDDLVKWDAALDGDALLSPVSKALLWTPPALPNGAPTEYAGGWMVTRVGGHALIWHNGATMAGFTGAIFRFPDDKLTVIALSNGVDIPGLQTGYPMYALTLGLAKLYLPDLAKADAPVTDTEPQVTQMLRQALTDLAAGKADPSHFTPAMSAALTRAVIAQTNHNLAPLGTFQPQSLTPVGRADEGGLRVYRYRALYGETPVIWMVHLTPEGKIAGMVPQGE